jgi:hypothetical protein
MALIVDPTKGQSGRTFSQVSEKLFKAGIKKTKASTTVVTIARVLGVYASLSGLVIGFTSSGLSHSMNCVVFFGNFPTKATT